MIVLHVVYHRSYNEQAIASSCLNLATAVSSLQVNAVQQNIDKMNEEQRQMIAAAEHEQELLLVTLPIDHKYKTAMNKPIILAVLVEHRLVADTDRHRQTDTGPWLVPRVGSPFGRLSAMRLSASYFSARRYSARRDSV